MLKTYEVLIDEEGRIYPVEPNVRLPRGHALLTILPDSAGECALLSEVSLAREWLTPEEDEAWAHLNPDM